MTKHLTTTIILLIPAMVLSAGVKNSNAEALTSHETSIEDLWPAGTYGSADGQTEEWEETPAWLSRWGNDLRVGTEDSVYMIKLVNDPTTSRLYAVLLSNAAGNRWLRVYRSANGGVSWEYVAASVSTYADLKASAATYNGLCYICYSSPNGLRLVRVSPGDYGFIPFPGGSSVASVFTTTTETAKEISMAASEYMVGSSINPELYAGSIFDSGILRVFKTNDTACANWLGVSSGLSGDRGLDLCGNYRYGQYYLFLSYLTGDNRLKVMARRHNLQWDTVTAFNSYSNCMNTSIVAHNDTVLAAFEDIYGSNFRVRYRTSYNGGADWAIGNISSQDTIGYFPDAAMGAGSTGVVYYQGTPFRCDVKTRPNQGGWTAYTNIAENSLYSVKPSIAYLSPGFGVLYISGGQRQAFFDRSSWTGVEGPSADSTSLITGPLGDRMLSLMPNFPNPVRGRTNISFNLPKTGTYELRVYNIAGQMVDRLGGMGQAGPNRLSWNAGRLAAGVYLYQVSSNGQSATRKLVVIR